MALVHRKKYVATAAILGTAILLTCVGVLFDALVHAGSTASLIGWSVPLAILVVAILTGFHWVLENWVDSATVENAAALAIQRASHSRFRLRNGRVLRGPKISA